MSLEPRRARIVSRCEDSWGRRCAERSVRPIAVVMLDVDPEHTLWLQPRPGDLALEHVQLIEQHQDLDLLRRVDRPRMTTSSSKRRSPQYTSDTTACRDRATRSSLRVTPPPDTPARSRSRERGRVFGTRRFTASACARARTDVDRAGPAGVG
jgi:hypothetical protein